jgi:hypothetical protein
MDFKEKADEEVNKPLRFKGKLQEACAVNRNVPYWKLIERQECGWLEYQHCSCHVCELLREENGLKKCVDKSCEGCQNIASGKKVFNWLDVWNPDKNKL